MSTLYIMCGIPASGKSTFARKYLTNIKYVSRDIIRFSYNPTSKDEYFKHETEVFATFVSTLATALSIGEDVIADATHLESYSRRKLTNAIDAIFSDYDIIYVACETPMKKCLERNALREGIEKVPEDVIVSMHRNFKCPTMLEDKRARGIIRVRGEV